MTTEEMIFAKYGQPFLNLEQVAELLGRSPTGLQATMYREGGIEERLRTCRVKFGRRSMFRVTDLAKVLDEA